ncbi:MAG: serine/threonine-protein kinase, partial [Planctomycetaceae bacterium]
MGPWDELRTGERIGDLRIERVLGHGAFAVVYLATDTLLHRPVALKVLRFPSAGAATPETDRALAEARIVGALKSPHVVTLYRVHGAAGTGRWMFEMEYIEGESLEALLQRTKVLPPERLERILEGILRGLEAAHGGGVAHGDIKPANVLLGAAGEVKLADFGLARLLGEASLALEFGDGGAGTPRYMAPEVIM